MTDAPDGGEEGLSRAQLKSAALRGVRWVVAGRAVVETASLASSVLIARLVSPAEFGTAAPAAFFFSLSSGLVMGSFATPLVQVKVLREAMVRTAFAMSLVTGVAMTALVLAATPLLHLAFPARAVELIAWASPTFLLYSLGAVSQAMLQRDLDFRRTSVNEAASLLPGILATIGFALAGLGALSIVLGFLVQAAAASAQAIAWRRPPRPAFERGAAREILGFGLPSSATTLLFVAQRNVGLVVLGARLAPAQVGLYWRAAQLGIEYQGKISGILVRLLFPLLSRTRNLDDMRAVRSRMVKVHTVLLFPLLTLLIVIAPLFIPWLYGERWADAAPAAQLLALAGFVAVVGTGTGPLLLAAGKPAAAMRYNAAGLVVFAVTVFFAAPYGLLATCAAVAGFRFLNLVAGQYLLVQRVVGIPVRETLVSDTFPALASCAALAAVAWPVTSALEGTGIPDFLVMAAASLAGFAAYGLALRVGFPATWRDIRTLFGRLGARRRPAAVAAGGAVRTGS